MGRTVITKYVRVFLTSPGDVKKYREIVKKTISSLNDGFLKTDARKYELVSSDDTSPDYGTDAQDIVTEQVGHDYDMQIVVFWHKYGTPTPRSSSGTAEEFEISVERFERTGHPRIMVYQCLDKIAPDEIDGEQFTQVQRFFDGIKDKSFYRKFSGVKKFEFHIKRDLENHIERLRSNDNKQIMNDEVDVTKI